MSYNIWRSSPYVTSMRVKRIIMGKKNDKQRIKEVDSNRTRMPSPLVRIMKFKYSTKVFRVLINNWRMNTRNMKMAWDRLLAVNHNNLLVSMEHTERTIPTQARLMIWHMGLSIEKVAETDLRITPRSTYMQYTRSKKWELTLINLHYSSTTMKSSIIQQNWLLTAATRLSLMIRRKVRGN